MAQFNIAGKLHEALAAVCPIDGVSIGRKDDKATWRIDFRPAATTDQKTAAQAILAAFDSAAAQEQDRIARERENLVKAKMKELAEAMVDDPTLLDKLKAAK